MILLILLWNSKIHVVGSLRFKARCWNVAKTFSSWYIFSVKWLCIVCIWRSAVDPEWSCVMLSKLWAMDHNKTSGRSYYFKVTAFLVQNFRFWLFVVELLCAKVFCKQLFPSSTSMLYLTGFMHPICADLDFIWGLSELDKTLLTTSVKVLERNLSISGYLIGHI